MVTFTGVEAALRNGKIHVRFRLGSPCVLGWQIYDPSTAAFLFEGEWKKLDDPQVEMTIDLPEEDGPYRVQVAPVEDRTRFILIDAQVSGGAVSMDPPRVTTASALARERFLRAIPKAFTYPPRSLWRNRKLIRSMVRRDLLARYRGSFGGALWTFLNPLLLMATYAFLFGVVLKQRFGADASGIGYVLYFLAGMLPWLAFSEAVGRAPYVIVEHRNFVKKLVFPLETLPANLVISGAVTEMFGLLIFVAGLVGARHTVPAAVVWLPALVIPQLLLTAGLCWFLAALGIFVRDLGAVIGFILTLWFFLTPICYPEASWSSVPAGAVRILSANPMYILVRGYRAIFLESKAPEWHGVAALWIASGIVAILGHAWFHRMRKSFADVI